MRRSLLALLVLGIVALGLVWVLARGSSGRAEGAGVARPGAAAAPAAETAATPVELDAPGPSTEDGAVARAGLQGTDGTGSARSSLDATRELLVEVRLPAGSPPDETLAVHAFAVRTDGDAGAAREACEELLRSDSLDASWGSRVDATRTPLQDATRVRVPVPADAVRATLAVLGRYVACDPQDVVLDEAFDPGSPVLLEPELGAWVVGRVVLPAGWEQRTVDLDELTVELHGGDDGPFSFLSGDAAREARLAPDRSFELRAVRASRAGLMSEVPGLVPFRQLGIPLEPGRRTEVEVAFRLGGVVSGHVRDEGGQPVAGALVRQQSATWFLEQRSTVSGQDGAYRLEGLAPGSSKLAAEADHYADAEAGPFELADAEERTDVDLVLSRGGSLSGRVLWPDGRPAAGASVDATQDARTARNPFDSGGDSTRTDEEGRFTLTGLAEAACEVEASLTVNAAGEPVPDPEPRRRIRSLDDLRELSEERSESDRPSPEGLRRFTARASAEPGATAELVLTLAAPATIRGRVEDETGRPVTAPFVVTAEPQGDRSPFSFASKSVHEDFYSADGAFELEDVPAGSWSVEALSSGYAEMEPVEVEVPQAEPVVLVLGRGVAVTGLVLDPAGTPVAEARVQSRGTRGDPMRTVQTDDEGRFRLEGLQPGGCSLTAEHEAWAGSEPVALELAVDLPDPDVVLTLRVGGRITGEVYTDEGEPRVGQNVGWSRGGMNFGGDKGTRTDGQGHFVLEHVTPGRVTVTAMPSEEELLSMVGQQDDPSGMIDVMGSMRMETVDVADGGEAHVVLGGTPKSPVAVRGVVREAGAPVAEAMLVALAEGGTLVEGMKAARTDADGRFEVVLDRPGAYVFHVDPSGTGQGGLGSEFFVDVPAAATHEVELDLPTGRVSGRVLDPDGLPIEGVAVRISNSGGVQGIGDLDESGSRTTDADGRFAFVHLRPGSYSLHAGGPAPFAGGGTGGGGQHGAVTLAGIEVGADDAVEGVELRLRRAGTLFGHVRDTAGRPVEGASIFVRDEAGHALSPLSAVTTDPGGRFEHAGLPAGELTVEARAHGLVTRAPVAVRVVEGQETEVDLELDEGAYLVISPTVDGEPVRARLRVTDGAGREVQGLFAQSDLEALFVEGFSSKERRVGPVPPGEYRVEATTPDGKEAHGTYAVRAGREERKIRLRLR